MLITQSIKELITTPQNVVITTHFNPDADAMGSSLALYQFLLNFGHSVQVITPSEIAENLMWMHGSDKVLAYSKNTNHDLCLQKIEEASLIFCLDFSGIGRIEALAEPVLASNATKVIVDHHINPESFANILLHNTEAAATCELIYDLIVNLGHKNLITNTIAQCLYAGIMADTGSFRHPNTTAHVHQIVADLIANGLHTNIVHRNLHDNNSLEKLQLLGYLLSEKLKTIPGLPIAYLSITAQELIRFNSKSGDTEGIVNYALGIKGIKMACIMIEREDMIKMSFRSTEHIAVNDIAQAHFSGGGHKNAAGGRTQGIGLEATQKLMVETMYKYSDRFI